MISMQSRIGTANRWADFYRGLGLNPLPSCADRKRPPWRYAEYRDRGMDARTFADWGHKAQCPNLQLATGRPWGLVVGDLDGEGPIAHWTSMTAACGLPEAPWIVVGSNEDGSIRGMHVWFSVEADGPPIRSGILHGKLASDGRSWVKRSQIERKGDRSLIIAPPSWHVETARPYKFLEGFGPRDGPRRPGMAPQWFLDLPTIAPPRRAFEGPKRRPTEGTKGIDGEARVRYTSRQVMEAIPESDKVALARDFGLRFAADRPNAAGWLPVHSLFRDDRTPSASFNPRTGTFLDFADPGAGPLSLFDLGAEIGGYPDWMSCRAEIARRYLGNTGVQP